jgi:hypothetical protein
MNSTGMYKHYYISRKTKTHKKNTKQNVLDVNLKNDYFELIDDDDDLKMGNNAKTYLDNNKSKILSLIDDNLESSSIFSSTPMRDISTFKTSSSNPKPGSRFQEQIIRYDEFFSKLKSLKPFIYKTQNNQVIHCKNTVSNIDALVKDIVKDVNRTTFNYENNFYKYNFERLNINTNMDDNKGSSYSKMILFNFCSFLNYIFPSYKCNICFKNDFLQSLKCNDCSKLSADKCTNINTLFSKIHTHTHKHNHNNKENDNKNKTKTNNNNNNKLKIQDECIDDLKDILYNYLLFYQNYDFELIEMLSGYDLKYNLHYVIGNISNKYIFFDTHNDKKIKYTVYYIYYRLPTTAEIIDLGYIVNVVYLDEPKSHSFNYVDLSRAPKDFFVPIQTVKRGGTLKYSKCKTAFRKSRTKTAFRKSRTKTAFRKSRTKTAFRKL